MELLQTIEWRDTTGTEIVHRWPAHGPGTVRLGAQLTVRESQTAIFFRDGQALDVFGPGRHTLTSLNLPLLQTIIALPFGAVTPFQCEVYFVNMRTFTNMKWGTPSPIVFRDSELQFVRLRAYGLYTLRIAEPQLFVNIVVGTEHRYEQETLEAWLRDFIIARFNDTLGEVIDTILDLPKMYDELGVAVRTRVGQDFERYGIELVDLLVEAVTPPEEVLKMLDERTAMEAVGDMRRFTQYQTAQAIRAIPGPGGGEGGVVGSAAAAGAGLGAGVGMGAAMVGAMRDVFAPPAAPQAPAATPQPPPGPPCPSCQAGVPAGARFCPQCGAALTGGACAKCGAELSINAKFCAECGEGVGA